MKKLYNHQIEGIPILQEKPRHILADDMGLGKTCTVIRAMFTLKNIPQRIIVVCPKTLIDNWVNELIMWSGKPLKITVLKRSNLFKIMKDQPDVLICSYESLRILEGLQVMYPADCMIMDECHKIKNRNTYAWKIIKEFSKTYSKMRMYFLSATPNVNIGTDVWSYLNIICPTMFSSYHEFIQEFFDVKKVERNGVYINKPIGLKKYKKEDFQGILGHFMTRRTKEECLDLPEKSFITIPLNMTKRQRELYTELESSFSISLNDLDPDDFLAVSGVLAQITRSKQLCVSPDLVIPGIDSLDDSPKAEMVKELISNTNDKVVVFSQFAMFADRMHKYYSSKHIPCAKLTGSMTQEQRSENVRKFKENPDCKMIFISTKAGGYGLNLVEANTVIMVDSLWNPAANNQAIDRTHRIGQTKNVTIYYLEMNKSIEQRINAIVREKEGMFDETINETGILSRMKNQDVA